MGGGTKYILGFSGSGAIAPLPPLDPPMVLLAGHIFSPPWYVFPATTCMMTLAVPEDSDRP